MASGAGGSSGAAGEVETDTVSPVVLDRVSVLAGDADFVSYSKLRSAMAEKDETPVIDAVKAVFPETPS